MITINDINTKQRSANDFVFFWGHNDRNEGKTDKQCLSQWYPSPFVINGVCYNCAEQYIMAEKAYAFCDEKAWHEIMSAYDSMTIKKLGRRVRNFNAYVWDIYCHEVAKTANLAKFHRIRNLKIFYSQQAIKL